MMNFSTREAMSIAQTGAEEDRNPAECLLPNGFRRRDPVAILFGLRRAKEAAQRMFRVANTISTFGQERADAQRGIRAALKLRDPDAPGVAKIP